MRKILFSLVLSMFAASAMAGSILVEPYIGYNSSTGEVKDTTTDLELSGIQFGGRLGYNFALFTFGIQYDQLKTSNFKSKGHNALESEADFTNLGVFALGSLPIVGWRIWGSYFWDAQVEGTKAGSAIGDRTRWGGMAFAVGVGYKLPAIPAAINLEYRMANYDKKDLDSPTQHERDITSWIATISFPLEF